MDIFLKLRLRAMAKRLAPRREFVRSLERQILEKTGGKKAMSPVLRWATAGVTIGLVAMASTGAYAYTSDDVLPDTPLYPVRQAIERIEEVTAMTPGRKSVIRLKMLKRREHERDILIARRKHFQETIDERREAATTTEPSEAVVEERPTVTVPTSSETNPTTTVTTEVTREATSTGDEPESVPVRVMEPRRELNYRLFRERWLKRWLQKIEENKK